MMHALATAPARAAAPVAAESFPRAAEQRPAVRQFDLPREPVRPIGHDFARVHIEAPNRTIIEGAEGAEELLRRRNAEQPEEPPPSLVRVAPRPVSLAAMQELSRRGGPLVTGPPVGKPYNFIQSGGGAGAGGYTDYPARYKAPDFDFNSTQTGTDWNCKPTLKTAANEGTSGSFYTAPGMYKTGTEGGYDVMWEFTQAISDLIKKGEQEHCDDFTEAYNISLKEAETIINGKLVGKTFGPKSSKADAEQLVLAEITSNLTHAQLGNDKTKWASKYSTLFYKTLDRDNNGWHSVSVGPRRFVNNQLIDTIVAGSSQIGSHSSSSIIKY